MLLAVSMVIGVIPAADISAQHDLPNGRVSFYPPSPVPIVSYSDFDNHINASAVLFNSPDIRGWTTYTLPLFATVQGYFLSDECLKDKSFIGWRSRSGTVYSDGASFYYEGLAPFVWNTPAFRYLLRLIPVFEGYNGCECCEDCEKFPCECCEDCGKAPNECKCICKKCDKDPCVCPRVLSVLYCPNCDNPNCQLPRVLGQILGNPTIGIFDALEILKAIVGMKGIVGDCVNALQAALILPTRPHENTPNIFDALEILKYIVGMNSLVK
jgi:hypothetical protein